MIEVGESLGNRYKVSRVPEDLRPGAVIELADRGVAVVLGQVLSDAPVTAAMIQEVRGDLTVVPAMPTILKPRDIAMSARGIPLGILERPGLARLRDRVATVDAEQKKLVATALLRAFATLASDLAMLHQSGQTHGAISSGVLLTGATGEVSGALLSGFGVVSFARRLGKLTKEPTARGDLVDLLGALHDLFLAAGVQPDGGAAAKWTLLRHAAMHGEHPALASGNALATQLNEIASLPGTEDRPVRTSRTPTMMGPGRARQSLAPGAPSDIPLSTAGRPATLPPTNRSKTIPPSGRGSVSVAAPQRPPRRWRFSVGILVGGLVGIALLGAAAAYYAWDLRAQRPEPGGRLIQPRRRPAPAGCPGEPTTLASPDAVQEFDATCVEGELIVATRASTRVVIGRRGAARGRAFGEAQSVGEGVVEMGTLLAAEGGPWVSWRHGIGAPFGVARLDAAGATPRRVELPGWDAASYHGAALVHVEATRAWIVTTVTADVGDHAVLVEAPLVERGRVATWYLGAGEAVAQTTGARATVLLDARAQGRHALTATTVDLAALAAAAAERPSVRGQDLPAAAVTRSEALAIESDGLAAVRRGVTLPSGARAFVVSTGEPRAEDACPERRRCIGAGEVRLAVFPASGPFQVTRVAERAWAEDLRATDDGSVEVVSRAASPAGTALPQRLGTVVNAAGAVAATRVLSAGGPHRARVVVCGGEPWLLQPAESPRGIAAAPASCSEQP